VCMCNLLWSDPKDRTGWGMNLLGASYLFGSNMVAQFNVANDIDIICCAYQIVMEDYKWHISNTVYTVWSAPNYCYQCGNVARWASPKSFYHLGGHSPGDLEHCLQEV
jgi:hypothetical protein